MGHANGVDWLIGRKLPSMVAALGLGHPQAKTFAEVRDRLIAAGHLDAATIDAASALLDDPNYWTQCWMMTAVWVRKPLPDTSFAAASK